MAILNLSLAQAAASLIRALHHKGYSPGTSTNYSFRNDENTYAISQSGIDKSQFSANNWLLMDAKGQLLPEYAQHKPSAETLLHVVLYQENPQIGVILHTHSIYGTVLSRHYAQQGRAELLLENYEVLKGFEGIQTHATAVRLPIFPNTQDMCQLSEDFRQRYRQDPHFPAYLIAGHGLYTWGKDLASAKRHLEMAEFLLECEYKHLLLAKV
jgi:methylthioribulose-1-phosphate dehydratase